VGGRRVEGEGEGWVMIGPRRKRRGYANGGALLLLC
jgi:hypothetical protein